MLYRDYDALRWEHFINWCYDRSAITFIPVKALMKNDYLLNWYHDQWLLMVEQSFLNDNLDFMSIDSPCIYYELLCSYPDEILNYYPQPLLKMIKKELKTA